VWTGALACSLCKLVGLIHGKMHVGASSVLVKTEIYVLIKTRPLNPRKTHHHLTKSIASCSQSNTRLSLV